MEPFDIRKFSKQINYGRGLIKDKKTAKDLLIFGYSPEDLLLHYDITESDTLWYILAHFNNFDFN